MTGMSKGIAMAKAYIYGEEAHKQNQEPRELSETYLDNHIKTKYPNVNFNEYRIKSKSNISLTQNEYPQSITLLYVNGSHEKRATFIINDKHEITRADLTPTTIEELMRNRTYIRGEVVKRLPKMDFSAYDIGEYRVVEESDKTFTHTIIVPFVNGDMVKEVELSLNSNLEIGRALLKDETTESSDKESPKVDAQPEPKPEPKPEPELSLNERKAQAINLILQLIRATNDGSVEGQLRCYAEEASYFNKGIISRSLIHKDLQKWKSTYSLYHVKILDYAIAPSSPQADCQEFLLCAHVSLDWRKKDARGRGPQRNEFLLIYKVDTTTRPKIIYSETRPVEEK